MKLRVLPEQKPTTATVTISESSMDPNIAVLEVAYGHARLTITVHDVEIRDLRPAPADTAAWPTPPPLPEPPSEPR